ncbi:phytoene desaturase family protein [Bacteroidia bacterium]|nr:phytoene desaturase family protein [Bacteroidia bacterium]
MKISVIGSGFSSLSNACYLAKNGHQVEVFEKNDQLGGRARIKKIDGFTFDMGPSWYWMPDVFDEFFADFGKKVSDFYDLKRLDPSYRVFWPDAPDDIPASVNELKAYFEKYEKGSGEKLDEFLAEAKMKYEVGMGDFVTKPSLSFTEFMSLDTARKGISLDLFKPISKHIRQYFKHPKLIELLEFPVLFLGAKPQNTPSLYSLMNYADMALGTWYPMGGMHKIVEAMVSVASELGVVFHTSANVTEIIAEGRHVLGLTSNNLFHAADAVVSGADYHHTEQSLLPEKYRNYNQKYWDSRVMAPSSLLYYVGLNKKIDGIKHHNLFFDESFDNHAVEIYDTHTWPEAPLFYVCNPSKTDESVAPEGKENLFFLVPVSTELKDNEPTRQRYFNMICDRLEKYTGHDIRPHIEVYESFAHSDFVSEYNSFKGNAYGLANTLKQTAILKPKCKNKQLDNLYYIGQLTVPGPGVPPSIISGKIVSQLIQKEHHTHESII